MASFTIGSSNGAIADAMETEKEAALRKAGKLLHDRVEAEADAANPLTRSTKPQVLIDGTERPNGLPENVDLTESRWW